jgi:hypothetical protein
VTPLAPTCDNQPFVKSGIASINMGSICPIAWLLVPKSYGNVPRPPARKAGGRTCWKPILTALLRHRRRDCSRICRCRFPTECRGPGGKTAKLLKQRPNTNRVSTGDPMCLGRPRARLGIEPASSIHSEAIGRRRPSRRAIAVACGDSI